MIRKDSCLVKNFGTMKLSSVIVREVREDSEMSIGGMEVSELILRACEAEDMVNPTLLGSALSSLSSRELITSLALL